MLVGLLDNVAMNAAMRRLVKSGVAPRGETPLEFDTAAVPGNARFAPILLLTASAIYAGRMNQPGGTRLPVANIGRIFITEDPRSVRYQIFDTDGDEWCDLSFRAPRPGFKSQMARLDPGPQRLPGLTTPIPELLGAPELASVGGRLLRLKRGAGPIEAMNHAAAVLSYTGGLAVMSAPGGIVWRSPWTEFAGATMAEGASPGGGQPGHVLLEVAARDGSRAAMQLPPLALFITQDRPTDAFLLDPSVEPFLKPSRYSASNPNGAALLPLVL